LLVAGPPSATGQWRPATSRQTELNRGTLFARHIDWIWKTRWNFVVIVKYFGGISAQKCATEPLFVAFLVN
jgi:hypothetical protein